MLARLRVDELPATKLAGPAFGLAPVRILARWSIFDTSLLPDSCARALPSSSLPSSFALSRGGSRKVRRGAAPGGSQSRGDFDDDALSSSAAAPPPLSARGARHPRPHSVSRSGSRRRLRQQSKMMAFERISVSQALQCIGDVELEFTMIQTVDNRPRFVDRRLVEPIAPFSSYAVLDQILRDAL